MKPPTRNRTAKDIYESVSFEAWTLDEKKALREALKYYNPDDLSSIRDFIPTRTQQDIHFFISRMKRKAENKHLMQSEVKLNAPIEVWLELAETLTFHDIDYSYIIGQVMSMAANLEPHQPPEKPDEADYRKLHAYISALLQGQQLPQLNPIDAAVILDLTEHLAGEIESLDVSQQKELMLRKYKLLKVKVDTLNVKGAYEATRKALEEDPMEVSVDTPPGGDNITEQGPSISEESKISDTTNGVEERENGTRTQQGSDPCIETVTMVTETDAMPTDLPSSVNLELPSAEVNNSNMAVEDLESSNKVMQTFDTPVVSQKEQRKLKRKRKVDLIRKHGKYQECRPSKTMLYTLNPFCVPVKYLRPQRKQMT